MPQVIRRDIIIALVEDRPEQNFDPLGSNTAEVRVHDGARFCFQASCDFKNRPEGTALSREAVIRRDDLVQGALAFTDEHGAIVYDALRHNFRRPVRGTPVRIDQHGAGARKIFGQADADSPDDVSYRIGVVVAGYADENFGLADRLHHGFCLRRQRRGGDYHRRSCASSALGSQAWSCSIASIKRSKISGTAPATRLQFESIGTHSGSSRNTSVASFRPFENTSTAVRSSCRSNVRLLIAASS